MTMASPTPASDGPPATGSSPAPRAGLQRQLQRRFLLVFLIVALLGSLLMLLGYQWLVREAQQRNVDAATEHLNRRYEALLEGWQRNADEVKTQIDFMRVFAPDDQRANWLRLRAYFSSMEGRLDRFPSGAVLDAQGQPVFLYGSEGRPLVRWLDAQDGVPRWYLSREHKTVYAILSVPLWLGVQGSGRLVMLQPLDHGVMVQLATPGNTLMLVHGGRVLASSTGSVDAGREVDAGYSGRLRDKGAQQVQRSLPAFEADSQAPQLVLRQELRQVLSPWLVALATGIVLGLLTLTLWLVIGRWSQRLAARFGQLSRASALFARDHLLNGQVHEALDRAAASDDEIGAVAESSRALMQSVIAHDLEHFAYLQTLDILEEGVVELGPEGQYRRASPGWQRLAGRTEGSFYDAIHVEDQADLRTQLASLFSGDKTGANGRVRLWRDDGKDLWIEYRFVIGDMIDGRVNDVRGVLRDITQSYQLEKHVTHMALHDALTGLPNRVLLEDRCKMALRSAERNGMKVALAFFDLDHFKHVNDQFGHKVGDELLTALSNGLRKCLRSGDTLARWGGDEFVVLLTDLSGQADAENAIAKLTGVCQKPIRVGDNEFNATFSMGVALYPSDADTVETLLSQADRAMFAAKQQGRNAVCFYAALSQREEDRKALYIQNRLASAIREHQIQVWFQPIVDARTRRVVGCEALARWQDETYGWVSPATFVPMAENLGLIREMGQQVWRQAIESLHRWRQRGLDIRMAVNVSRRQLFTPTFTADLLVDLERLGIPVSVVDLEITESVAMEDAEHTERRLAELKAAGFGIAIDDFGTGYSSLSQLHDMPASKIKIDTSFVRRAQVQEGSQLIQAIVKIAAAFRLQTVAEGVETDEIANSLTTQGVHLLQGYHFGRPMNAESFERYLDEHFRAGAAPR